MKYSNGERVLLGFNHFFLVLISATMLFPFINIIAKSFSGTHAILSGDVSVYPIDFTTFAWKRIFQDQLFLRALLNSVFITVSAVMISGTVVILTAFPLSKNILIGRKFFSMFFLTVMIFHGGPIPSYMIFRGLGLLNTLWVLILPTALNIYFILLVRSYFETIPADLYNSTTIDGANDYQQLIHIALPISIPILATITLFNAVSHWNLYQNAVYYVTDTAKYPIQRVVYAIVSAESGTEEYTSNMDVGIETFGRETIVAAAVAFAALPIIVVYPFLQRYFVKGITIGAVKE